MNIKLETSLNRSTPNAHAPAATPQPASATSPAPADPLADTICDRLFEAIETRSRSGARVSRRIAREVERICEKSDRIQKSGEVAKWQMTLAQHRIQKMSGYYKLGSKRGRMELHSHLSMIVYRHIAPTRARLGFQGRYNLIEDFLQGFYIEVLRAFRREHDVAEDYTPRTRLELAEYMAFTEQYAKRRISLPGRNAQQLVILRAQGFAKGQPPETSIDMELAVESGKTEEDESVSRSAAARQVREQMVAETVDPSEAVMRDRVVKALVGYLKSQGQTDCIDYLTLKLQDLPAYEIDDILGLSARQRDYLQQRFKYHVEKFARAGNWKLVHQWLGADLDRNLGMSPGQWQRFLRDITPQQQRMVALKQDGASEADIAAELKCTPKQVQKRWTKLLDTAWQYRND